MRVALVVLAILLLSGCSSKPPAAAPSQAPSADQAAPGAASGNASAEVPIHFAAKDFEADVAFPVTFQPTDFCSVTCGNAQQHFDLTPEVPADAPVQLTVSTGGSYNVDTELTFDHASALRYDYDFSTGTTVALVVRAAAGTVGMNLTYGDFPARNGTSPVTVQVTVHASVQGSLLLPYVPATVQLAPTDHLNVTGSDIQQLFVLSPNGAATHLTAAPFLFAANGTAGAYTILVAGKQPVQVSGPNATMVARQVDARYGAFHDVASGSPTTWTFDAPSPPLEAGLVFSDKPTAGPFSVAPLLGDSKASITSPDNVVVAHGECKGDLLPVCTTAVLGVGGGSFGVSGFFYAFGDFLDEHYVKGTYTATVDAAQANGVQVQEFLLFIGDP